MNDRETASVFLTTERNQLGAVRSHYSPLSFQHQDAVRRIAEIDAELARRATFRENVQAAIVRLGGTAA